MLGVVSYNVEYFYGMQVFIMSQFFEIHPENPQLRKITVSDSQVAKNIKELMVQIHTNGIDDYVIVESDSLGTASVVDVPNPKDYNGVCAIQ